MEKNRKKIRALAVTGIMGAIAAVMMFIEFPIPIMPSFIKLDFSDLPGLVTAFAFGPIAGVGVSLIKNLVHLLFTKTAGVGELANFLIAAVFTFIAGIIYKRFKSRKGALAASCAASVAAGIVSVISNYFIIYPFYYKMGMAEEAVLGMYRAILPGVKDIFHALLIFNLPFTVVKCLIVSLFCFLIYKRLSPILKAGRNKM